MSVISKFLGISRADSLQLNDGSSTSKGSIIYQTRVTLTSAQILALHSTPITLIAAPGSGKYLSVVELTGILSFNSAAYVGTNAVEIRYTDGSGAKVTGDLASSWLDSAATAAVKAVSAAVTPAANAAVVAAIPVANPTAGDSTITLEILYRVVTLP